MRTKVASALKEIVPHAQCLICGTVGPEKEEVGEAYRALTRTPYRANRGAVSMNCTLSSRRMKGARGALAARATAGLGPLL
jgi:predicted nucleic acid-binding Zn ribbon protein